MGFSGMKTGLSQVLSSYLGCGVSEAIRLHGGCIAEVYRLRLEDGRTVVAKIGSPDSQLDLEGWMLSYLKEHSTLPVPDVLASQANLLVLSFIPGDSQFGPAEQTHAAELLAALHQVSQPCYGLERDTLIGGLPQPNRMHHAWRDFFAGQRIWPMASLGHQEGKIPLALLHRLEAFCGRLDEWLTEPPRPALLHGDAWTTNMLAHGGRMTGFLDPAIYYGHPEIELAFTTLFGTFDEPFFKRYQEINPIEDGFFGLRKDLYNLYPLLVHVRLFGTCYLPAVERVLKRVGC